MVAIKWNFFELISFTSNDVSESIHHQFAKLNYRIVVRDTNEWLEGLAGINNNVSLIILGNLIPQKLKVILSTRARAPCLAIFDCPQSQWDQDIVNSVDDFCGWPCEQQELILRLERLRSKLGENVSKDTINNNEKEWIKLNLVGSCPAFIKLKSLIQKIARYDAPVLIEGKTGTGKEVTARAIHYFGSRSGNPFIPINCGALPDSLVENELFGHEKGAFTDARQRQLGLIAQANGGTLFLDEIESLTPKGQVALLRFTEDKSYKPLGSQDTKTADIRLISASNTSLHELVRKGEFREDLLFRLNVVKILIPSLRDRSSDIADLAEFFLQRFRKLYQSPDKRFDPETFSWMERHNWPGNIREFENYIHRAFLLADDNLLHPCEIDETNVSLTDRRKIPDRRKRFDLDQSFNDAKQQTINQFEQCFITKLLERTHGNASQAAKLAHKERRSFGKLLKNTAWIKINLEPTKFSEIIYL